MSYQEVAHAIGRGSFAPRPLLWRLGGTQWEALSVWRTSSKLIFGRLGVDPNLWAVPPRHYCRATSNITVFTGYKVFARLRFYGGRSSGNPSDLWHLGSLTT